VPGATNQVVEEAKRILYAALHEKTNIFLALARCRKLFAAIEVDRLRPKPRISIIGEFWAMTTEGDGNYHLQSFLEQEGGENDIQLTTAWLLYNIWEVSRDTREAARSARRRRRQVRPGRPRRDRRRQAAGHHAAGRGRPACALPGLRPAGRLHDYHLPDMEAVADAAAAYYSNDLRGGEGHMEVGKLIVNAVRAKAHMTVSVKPFGCMPSSGVSDGVQSLITARYPGTIFCAVETSGDGAANFYSRVQMYLFKARATAEAEVQKAYADCGVSEAQVRDFLKKHPRYGSPLHHPPHKVAGTAANLVYEVAPLMTRSRADRLREAVVKAATHAKDVIATTPERALTAWSVLRSSETRERLGHDYELVRDLIAGKVKERFAPLMKTLASRAPPRITIRRPSRPPSPAPRPAPAPSAAPPPPSPVTSSSDARARTLARCPARKPCARPRAPRLRGQAGAVCPAHEPAARIWRRAHGGGRGSISECRGGAGWRAWWRCRPAGMHCASTSRRTAGCTGLIR
jgi:hypothetical protein